MQKMRTTALLAGVFATALVLGACSSDDNSSTTTSKAPTSSSQAVSSESKAVPKETPKETAPAEEPAATTPAEQAKPTPQPQQDDDPGGHPCTDQSGAPGHLIPSSTGGWVCEITGDAPQN